MIRASLPVVVAVGASLGAVAPPAIAAPADFQLNAPKLRTSVGSLTETIAAEALDLRVNDLVSLGLDWEPTWGPWTLPLHIAQQGYQFGNPDYPGVLHRRQVTAGSLAIERRYRWASLALASGIGYQGQWSEVSSSAAAPTQPAPSVFWFSPRMAIHGIELRQRVSATLHPALGLGLGLRWTPLVTLNAQGPELPALMRLAVEPTLTLGTRQGFTLMGFADAVFDPGTRGATFQQVQAGIGLRGDLGSLEPDVQSARTWSEKALPAATSLLLPGAGQVWQGQVEKGLWHLALAATLWGLMAHAEAQQGKATDAMGVGANLRAMSAWGLLALTLWSPLDAWLYGERDAAAP